MKEEEIWLWMKWRDMGVVWGGCKVKGKYGWVLLKFLNNLEFLLFGG